ncbi:MAG: amino acid permease [Flavobacteriaceae bacterium]|nr:amino acid permease [Flavobacteriaceae bacterium]
MKSKTTLVRTLSLPSAIAISIGGMLSGIFVLPGVAFGITGPSVSLAFLVAGICIIPAVLSKAELATAMPKSGGTYVYIDRAFGPLFGVVSGIGLWLSLLLKSAFSLVGLSAYLHVLVELDSFYTTIVAIVSLLLVLVLNLFGVKKVGSAQLAIVGVSVTSLVVLIALGVNSVSAVSPTEFLSDGTLGFFGGVAFLYISYAGVTKIAAIAGEISEPEKNLPRTMIISLLLIMAVYVCVSMVLVRFIDGGALSTDIRPIYTAASEMGGPIAGYIAGVVGVMTLLSMANSGLLASSRFPFAMARDGALPKVFASISKQYLTPVFSIIVTAFAIALAVIFLDVVKIAKLASAFKVLMFILVNLSVIVFRETNAQWYRPKYKSPLYPFVQIFGILSGLFLLTFLGLQALLSVLAVFIIGFLVFLAYGRKTNRSGLLSNYGVFSFLFRGRRAGASETELDQDEVIEGIYSSDSQIVVPLLGDETSPEMIVEVASSINPKDSVNAINIIEAPDQTFLEDVNLVSPKDESVKRRILSLRESKNTKVTFESLPTHDVVNTIKNITSVQKCEWLVMGWGGRENTGILVRNPVGWVIKNINANLALFKDNGVRNISKVVLAVRPGREGNRFIKVADNICKYYGANLTLLNVIGKDAKKSVETKLHNNNNSLLKGLSREENSLVVKSNDVIGVISEVSASYDLLIIGSQEKSAWYNVLLGLKSDRFVKNSVCSVLRLTIRD